MGRFTGMLRITCSLAPTLLLCSICVACRGNDSPADADADGDMVPDSAGDTGTDADDDTSSDGNPDTSSDAEPDNDARSDADGSGCVYDTSIHHEVGCRGAVINVARDIDTPDGSSRVRYDLWVELPPGDYDTECVHLDRITVLDADTREIRSATASLATDRIGFMDDRPVFSFDDEALEEELAGCSRLERYGFLHIEFHGQSPVGTFGGFCNSCTCPSDDWDVAWACHRGLEASLWTTVSTRMSTSERPGHNFFVMVEGALGHHGDSPLTNVRTDPPMWRSTNDDSVFLEMTDPPWQPGSFNIFGSLSLDPGVWTPYDVFWSAIDPELPEGLCLSGSGLLYPSQLLITGTHSEGTFHLESPPIECLLDDF